MNKIIFDNLSYREGKPSAEQLGFIPLNFCNRGFYGLINGNISYDFPPNPNDINATLSTLRQDQDIYFDLEPWFCLPDTASRVEQLKKKMYALDLLSRFRQIHPNFNKKIGCFGLPDGNIHPENPPAAIEFWKNKNRKLMSGEIWDIIYDTMNCMFPCCYPYDYGNGDSKKTNDLQLVYNQLKLDITKEHNVKNYPVYVFWQPRLKKADGSRPFMTYQDTVLQLNWLMSRCDGIVLWDWDGQIDPQTGDIAVWDDGADWLRAVKDVQKTFNTPPKVQTMHYTSGTPFKTRFSG